MNASSSASNETATNDFDLEYQIGRLIFSYVLFVPTIIGILFNPLVVYIYSQKTFEMISATFYLKVLAIADLTINIQSLIPIAIITLDAQLVSRASTICKLVYFFSYLNGAICSWLEVCVSLDRCLSVTWLGMSTRLNNRTLKRTVLIALLLYNLALYSLVLHYYDSMGGVSCRSASATFAEVIGWYDMVSAMLLPFFIMLCCSILTIRSLVKHRQAIELTTVQSSNGASVKTSNHHLSINRSQQMSIRQQQQQKSKREREFQFSLISISMNVLFLLLLVPICVYFIYSSYVYMNPSSSFLFHSLTILIGSFNYSFKFFIFYFINTKFRSELYKIRLFNWFLRE